MYIGMTSSDVLDTAFSIQIKQSGELILKGLERLKEVLSVKAKEYKYLPSIGRFTWYSCGTNYFRTKICFMV